MKKILCSVLFLFLVSLLQAQFCDAIVGVWLSEDGKGKITVYKQGDKYFGKLSWLKEPYEEDGKTPKVDDENPNDDEAKKPLLGKVILKDFVFEDGFWQEGEIYDPESGKTYDCEMWLEGNNNLKIKGYWHFIYRVDTWTRSY
jgi:uncharacterized protein (DUF2147 family)